MKSTAVNNTNAPVNLAKLGLAFLGMGVIGLLISAWYNLMVDRQTYTIKPLSHTSAHMPPKVNAGEPATFQIGPIEVDEAGEVYELIIGAYVPAQNWMYVEVEVLDYRQEYLYSFGQELWHYTGRDSDGQWTDRQFEFDTKTTFTFPGYYYFNFIAQNSFNNDAEFLKVELLKRRGSSVPHSRLGIVCIVIAIVLFEMHSKRRKKRIKPLTRSKNTIIWVSAITLVLYIAVMPLANEGYGYMGYEDYHSEPAWWYWNNTHYYYDKNVRSGSVSGAKSRGGGPGQGK